MVLKYREVPKITLYLSLNSKVALTRTDTMSLSLTSDHEVCQALVDLLQDLAEDETFSCQALELGLVDLILVRTNSGQGAMCCGCTIFSPRFTIRNVWKLPIYVIYSDDYCGRGPLFKQDKKDVKTSQIR